MPYNPIPTRVWSRVQNPCSTNTDNSGLVYMPLSKQYVKPFQASYEQQMLLKGNILQYKKNSSNLTKNQRYSQIVKGQWTNRTKSFATQTESYTNPNTSSLLRVNYTNIPYPNTLVGFPNNPSGPFQYDVQNPFNCSTNILQDGGNLVCNATVDPCTNQIIQKTIIQTCYPTTCSDVPGQIQNLCWDDSIQTWYPKQRYVMTNSTSKWPEGYKGFVSAVRPGAPYLTLDSSACSLYITLSWTNVHTNCLPITSYNVYQNGAFLENVSVTSINILISGTTSFFVTALSGTIESLPSNIININCNDFKQLSALGSGLNAECNTIAFDPNGGNLYAGGFFTTAGGNPANYIATWNTTTNIWSPLGAGLNDYCNTITFGPDGNLYAGGNFTTAGGISANYIAKWNMTTNTWSPLDVVGLNNTCTTIAFGPNGNLYAGGYFTNAGGTPANYIATFNMTTNTWSSLDLIGLNSYCNSIAFGSDGNLYAGGAFVTAGGNPATGIAKWNMTINTWSALGAGLNNTCNSIALGPDGILYVGGAFINAGGNPANYIAAWNIATNSWSSICSGLNQYCYSVAVNVYGILYVGGVFTTAGGNPANYIAVNSICS